MGSNNTTGDQEKKNVLSNAQFLYDREWDYCYGISKNRTGARSGKAKKRPNRSAARIRIGLVDKGFLPYDSTLNQAELAKKYKAQQNKINKAKNDASGKTAVPDYDEHLVVLAKDPNDPDGSKLYKYKGAEANKVAFCKTSRARTFDTTTVYNALGELARKVMKEKGYDDGNKAPKDDLNVWFDCLLEILESSENILGHYVREDLAFGAYKRIKDREASKKETQKARKISPTAPAVTVYKLDMGQRLKYHEQTWNQRRRFLWDAYEVVMEGFRDSLIEQKTGLGVWADALSEYDDYFADSERAKQHKTRPTHPHLIDIADTKYPPASKKRAAADDDDDDNDDDDDDGDNSPKRTKTA